MIRLLNKIVIGVVASLLVLFSLSACDRDEREYGGLANESSYVLTLVGSGMHDTRSFTEGFFWCDGKLCESTGRVGESHFYKDINYTTGCADESIVLPEHVFGEGSVVLDGVLYVLTYKNKVAYRYDFDTLETIDEIYYPREGWGLTTDGEWLYASDGSDDIVVMDKNLSVQRSIAVTENGVPVIFINELEYIDGYIWANLWQTDDVVIIDPYTGEVLQRINLLDVLPASVEQYKEDAENVGNGLAYNADTDTLFVTGKCWGEIYELSLKR